MKRSLLLSIAGLLAGSDLVAQACAVGPGEVYGIVAYQCANCGFRKEKAERMTYLFYAEPVVTEPKSPGLFKVGDVIEAVDGKPITTTAGADLFTYPPIGNHEVSVRRGRVHEVLRFSVSGSGCDASSTPGKTTGIQLKAEDIASIEVVKGPAATDRYNLPVPNAGVVVITTRSPSAPPRTEAARDSMRNSLRQLLGPAGSLAPGSDPIIIVDGVQISPSEARSLGVPVVDRTGRFGFAVACVTACTAMRANDGPLHYTFLKYNAPVPIVAIRPGGPADRAGIRVGDLLVKVDGQSLEEDEGAKNLARLERVERARIVIRRDGKDTELVLQADR